MKAQHCGGSTLVCTALRSLVLGIVVSSSAESYSSASLRVQKLKLALVIVLQWLVSELWSSLYATTTPIKTK